MPKHCYSRFLPFAACVLFLSYGAAQAQITITASDVRGALRVGTVFTGYSTDATNPVLVPVGTASSAPQTWDFRSFEYTESETGESIDPATAPHISSFPDADLVIRATLPDQSSTTHQYMQVLEDKFLFHGLGFSDDTSLYRFTPPMVQMTFPCTYGTTWVYRSDPYSPVPGITMQLTETWTCDA
ncbi:MAG: hypothetical protein QHI48_08170 [Bacteroidota bacterium]|nr:hypothetical protein [Bacteroidota bacterium]